MSLESELQQFSGTENYYKHFLKTLVHTDGIEYLVQKYSAGWLVDMVAFYQPVKGEGMDDFQLWELVVKDEAAVITCRADSDEPAVIRQVITYTTFPESLSFYVENGVMLLKSEH